MVNVQLPYYSFSRRRWDQEMDPPALGGATVWTYMKTLANKRFRLNSPFYEDGNKACRIQLQSVAVDSSDADLTNESGDQFPCEVPGCDRWLGSVAEQELHYNSRHRYSCGVCGSRLHSPHTLQLHLQERHDSLFQLKAQRQHMYRCFAEWCEVVSADESCRRLHCAAEHGYPSDFSPEPPPLPQQQEEVKGSCRGFRTSGVASLRRSDAEAESAGIDMASLAVALQQEPF